MSDVFGRAETVYPGTPEIVAELQAEQDRLWGIGRRVICDSVFLSACVRNEDLRRHAEPGCSSCVGSGYVVSRPSTWTAWQTFVCACAEKRIRSSIEAGAPAAQPSEEVELLRRRIAGLEDLERRLRDKIDAEWDRANQAESAVSALRGRVEKAEAALAASEGRVLALREALQAQAGDTPGPESRPCWCNEDDCVCRSRSWCAQARAALASPSPHAIIASVVKP